jgi:hypothetical protein
MAKTDFRAWVNLNPKVRQEAIKMAQNFTVINGQAYDNETGENITDKLDISVKIGEGQRKGAQVKANLRTHQTETGGYVFALFHECQTIAERFPSLTQPDLARLMFIGTYVSYDEGSDASYGILKHPNGVVIDKKALRDLLKISRPAFNTFYTKLQYEGILAETDAGLAMNPSVFYRGENVKGIVGDMQYTRLFRQTVRDLYVMYDGKQTKKLGAIYAVLPYVNFNYNVLCLNPSEVQAEKVKPLTIGELAEILGYESDKKLAKTLREIKHEGNAVFGFFEDTEDRRKKKIVVNPYVIYAGNGKHLDGIKVLFNR